MVDSYIRQWVTVVISLLVLVSCAGKRTGDDQPACGNGVVELGEACDDGNNEPGDGCSPVCTDEVCGNGVVDPGEACDEGPENSDDEVDACRTDCRNARCGDGVADSGEACDGTELRDVTCLEQGFTGGALGCASDCLLDLSRCTLCGDGSCEGSETTQSCPADCQLAKVVTGGFHTCALYLDGSLKCWGFNSYGQLGDQVSEHDVCPDDGFEWLHAKDGPYDCSRSPVPVVAMDDAVDIALGPDYTCALRSDGTVWCWGSNFGGVLGDGTTEPSVEPVPVSGVLSATAISAGFRRSCAILAGGSVKCWGNSVLVPEVLEGVDSATQVIPTNHSLVSLGGASCSSPLWTPTCVLTAEGAVKCVVYGFEELQPVEGLSTAVKIASSPAVCYPFAHLLALLADGSVVYWGYGSLGPLPPDVLLPAGSALDIAAGVQQRAILRPDLAVEWTHDGTSLAVTTDVESMTMSEGTGCALRIGNEAACWGYNGFGQLGDGSYVSSATAVQVVGL